MSHLQWFNKGCLTAGERMVKKQPSVKRPARKGVKGSTQGAKPRKATGGKSVRPTAPLSRRVTGRVVAGPPVEQDRSEESAMFIAGIGASAGGLE